MKRKHRRLLIVGLGMAALGLAAGLVLLAFDENLVFFQSPTDLQARNFPAEQRIRIGGLVEENSFTAEGLTKRFKVTDLDHAVPVSFSGMLPDLFREGQGVVAEGYMRNGVFEADSVLAKHDENYMPPEVAEALKKAGNWKGEGAE
jgi:cytochrome c-type biogenesis protein CcmE